MHDRISRSTLPLLVACCLAACAMGDAKAQAATQGAGHRARPGKAVRGVIEAAEARPRQSTRTDSLPPHSTRDHR